MTSTVTAEPAVRIFLCPLHVGGARQGSLLTYGTFVIAEFRYCRAPVDEVEMVLLGALAETHFDKDVSPKAVLAAVHNMENAVHEFATTAQKLAVWPHSPAGDEAWLDHVERARVLAAAPVNRSPPVRH